MEQMLAFARNCAKEAGKIQLSYFRGNHLHIETKFNMHDVVTVAYKESERYIIGEI
jgi:myo-inositol-1(or 4)-monophosphatase